MGASSCPWTLLGMVQDIVALNLRACMGYLPSACIESLLETYRLAQLGMCLPEEIGHLHPQLGQFLCLADPFSPERNHVFTGDLAVDVVGPSHTVDLLGHFFANDVDCIL